MHLIATIAMLTGAPASRAVCWWRRKHDDLVLHDGSALCRCCFRTTAPTMVT